MKKIIAGLLFNGLVALNAGILSENPRHYRSLSSVEYAVFGSPDPVSEPEKAIKRICYIEVRYAAKLQAASSEDDNFLNEFEEVFGGCYEISTVGNIVSNFKEERNKADKKSIVKMGILVWFIRKAIDELTENIEATTQYNMLSFHRSYPLILKTIIAAIEKGSAEMTKTDYEDNSEHLQYPTLIGDILTKTVPW